MDVSPSWHEDERFWELAEPIIFDDERIYGAKPDVDCVLALTSAEPGSRVLDLCCGPGRHSVEFAKRGYRVTGVDRTARYLDRVRKAGGDLNIEFVHQDARQFVRPEAFDLAVNLYTSFGYFESPEDDLLVARNLARSLRPNGFLVIQTQGKEVMASKFVERTWWERGDRKVLQENRILNHFSAVASRWILIDPDATREIAFVVRLYSAAEMQALLATAGFSQVRILGSLEGTPYDQTARRLIVVARK